MHFIFADRPVLRKKKKKRSDPRNIKETGKDMHGLCQIVLDRIKDLSNLARIFFLRSVFFWNKFCNPSCQVSFCYLIVMYFVLKPCILFNSPLIMVLSFNNCLYLLALQYCNQRNCLEITNMKNQLDLVVQYLLKKLRGTKSNLMFTQIVCKITFYQCYLIQTA